jgi:predicted nucleotide-binding protein
VIAQREINSKAEYDAAKGDYYTRVELNSDLLKRRFTTNAIHEEYSSWFGGVFGPQSLAEDVEDFRKDVRDKIRRLVSIRERLSLIEEAASVQHAHEPGAAKPRPKTGAADTIFIVHCHNDAAKFAVHGFLRDITSLEPVILHNEPNRGQTIIEKFESVGASAGFAVVILTADDVGRAKDATDDNPRGRQNVVFEFGFFVGSLGRHRVVVLYEKGVELPSDVNGLLYIPYDPGGVWKVLLAKELKAARIEVDAARLIS